MRYLRRGVEEVARAEGEVILTAGAIGSPHLLLLSGIGPAEQLIEHGIRVVADSPGVGANLSDHPVVTAMWHTPRDDRAVGAGRARPTSARWRYLRSGPLTSNIAEAGGFTRTMPSLPAPDLQWHVLPVPFQRQGLADPAIRAISMLVTLVAVASRGVVRLRSADPRHKPAIDPGYLSASERHRAAAERAADGPGVRRRRAAGQALHGGTGARARRAHRRRAARVHPAATSGTLYHPVGHLRDGR